MIRNIILAGLVAVIFWQNTTIRVLKTETALALTCAALEGQILVSSVHDLRSKTVSCQYTVDNFARNYPNRRK